ncbi:hypothetical protein [Actinomadura rubrisoli]|uniref:Tail assembly chaperone n=1 Tax=Actinomadura rubrisoli TaxID=2530368 RepID=A0A4R5CDP4_9ACTN|nr:hypothetical protein [Actinomadura rubrisoli]TDD97645.1 hypothetical protein E1298_01020 [Actinomadura rubrisoli]
MPSKKYQLDKYRNEAVKPDFEIVVDAETSILIRMPTVDEVIDLNDITDIRAQLQILAKDQYERLMEVISDDPGAMLQPLMNDMLKHFGLGK